MSEYQLLINYHNANSEIAHQIYDAFQAEGVSCRLLPRVDSIETHFEVLEQIEETISAKGALLVVLSGAAIKDDLILANAQYSCDLAERRTMLVIYQVEKLPEDHPFKLYTPQSVVITDFKKKGSYSKLINTVKRVLGKQDAPNAFRLRVLSRKFIKQVSIIVTIFSFLLGVGSYIYPKVRESLQPEPPLSPTPILAENPFSGESIDQKIIVDRRDVPSVDFEGNPEDYAPFSFDPGVIHQQFVFDDATLDNINVMSLSGYLGIIAISEKDKTIVRQQNGVLQVAVAPSDEHDENHISFGIPHLIQSESFNYLGIRFKLKDYPGWSDEKLENGFGFGLSSHPNDLFAVNIGRRKIQPSPYIHKDLLLSDGWHAMEIVNVPESSQMDIYLDGELIGSASDEWVANSFDQLHVFLYAQYSTEWISLYIDEILFGGEYPSNPSLEAEDAAYYITPDEVFYHNPFDEMPGGNILAQGDVFGRVQDSKFRFDFSPEYDHEVISLQVPDIMISEMNYFSLRYRLTDWQQEPWSDWGEISIYLYDSDLRNASGCSIGVFESIYRAEYFINGGNNRIESLMGSWEDFQPGAWHTVEMAISPLDSEAETYLLQYWHDGCQVRQMEISDLDTCLGVAPLTVEFLVNSGIHRQNSFSGEIDEITVGKIDFGTREDFNNAGEE